MRFGATGGGLARGSIVNTYNKQRTDVFNRMQAIDDALDESEESSHDSIIKDSDEEELLSSDDEDTEMFDYEN